MACQTFHFTSFVIYHKIVEALRSTIDRSVDEPVTVIHDIGMLLDASVSARACATFVAVVFLSWALPTVCALTANCTLCSFRRRLQTVLFRLYTVLYTALTMKCAAVFHLVDKAV